MRICHNAFESQNACLKLCHSGFLECGSVELWDSWAGDTHQFLSDCSVFCFPRPQGRLGQDSPKISNTSGGGPKKDCSVSGLPHSFSHGYEQKQRRCHSSVSSPLDEGEGHPGEEVSKGQRPGKEPGSEHLPCFKLGLEVQRTCLKGEMLCRKGRRGPGLQAYRMATGVC